MDATAAGAELVARSREGSRRSLARLLSAVERGGDPGLSALLHGEGELPYTVGLTGAPGAGKSTLTDGLIAGMRAAGERCAVLAIDPSSPYTRGAILGDRVRLRAEHADDDGVFFRSLANRGRLGGLAAALPDCIRALGLAGWPFVLVETVGVGQAEVEIAAWADTTVVVVTPGWGDEVQANKAGLLEIADVLIVNKADRKGRGIVEGDLERMLDLSEPRDWRPPVVATIATEDEGIETALAAIADHRAHLESSGELSERRRRRALGELHHELVAAITRQAGLDLRSSAGEEMVEMVAGGSISPAAAAAEIIAASNGGGGR